MAWIATVTVSPLGSAGDKAKRSGGASRPKRSTISGREFLIASACCRIWRRWWLGVPIWPLPPSVPLVAGQSILSDQSPLEGLQYWVRSSSLQARITGYGDDGGLGCRCNISPLGDAGGRAKHSGRESPPVRATISGQKFLVASAHHRFWGEQWLGVAVVAAAPLGAAGGGAKRSGGAIPPRRATIPGQKFLVASAHRRLF